MVDDRSPMAKALSLVSQIMSIGLIGILPVIIGYGLDAWLQFKLVFTLGLGMLGMFAAIYQLVRLVKRLEEDAKSNSKKD
ncbi:MAG: AtpZ/AtpI family protein [Planctomycetota bacterium]